MSSSEWKNLWWEDSFSSTYSCVSQDLELTCIGSHHLVCSFRTSEDGLRKTGLLVFLGLESFGRYSGGRGWNILEPEIRSSFVSRSSNWCLSLKVSYLFWYGLVTWIWRASPEMNHFWMEIISIYSPVIHLLLSRFSCDPVIHVERSPKA